MTRESMADGGVKARRGDLLLIPLTRCCTASFSAAAAGLARSYRETVYSFAAVSGVARDGRVIRHVRHHGAFGAEYTRECKGEIVGGMVAPQERFAPHSADAILGVLRDREWESVDEARDALRAAISTLADGGRVAAVPQLFPTPADLAARVAELAAIRDGFAFLEPSAGGGNLVAAVLERAPGARAHMVEQNSTLAADLSRRFESSGHSVICGDFLEHAPSFGGFDRIVMNPPFSGAADIQHIQAAAKLLRPGGRLVAICANGPRQQRELKPLADHWEDLPAGAFAQSGTMVNAALLVIEKGAN